MAGVGGADKLNVWGGLHGLFGGFSATPERAGGDHGISCPSSPPPTPQKGESIP